MKTIFSLILLIFFIFPSLLPKRIWAEIQISPEEFRTKVLNRPGSQDFLKFFLKVHDEQKLEFLRFQPTHFLLRILFEERKFLPLIRKVLSERRSFEKGVPLNL